LFIVAVALMVWFMIPHDHMSIVVNPAQPSLSGHAAPQAPPGSVSGASTTTQTRTPTQPPLHPSP